LNMFHDFLKIYRLMLSIKIKKTERSDTCNRHSSIWFRDVVYILPHFYPLFKYQILW